MKSSFTLFSVRCWSTSLAILSLFVASCQTAEEEVPVPISTDQVADIAAEETYSGVIGDIETIQINGESVFAKHVGDEYVVQGDMLVAADTKTGNARSQAVGLAYTSDLWPDGIVYYTIDENMPPANQLSIRQAIGHWQDKTKIHFVEHTDQDNYVAFVPRARGCWAHIGKRRDRSGRQEIRLSPACDLGTTIHEIGHCVGLFHEHTRSNRDEHINILWDNIIDTEKYNFEVAEENSDRKVRDWAGTMNYKSIMMYGPRFFSKNGKPTIERIDGQELRIQRDGLSKNDIKGINRMYGEPPVKPNFPDPNKWYRISSQKRPNHALHDANQIVESYSDVYYATTFPYQDHWEGQRWRFVSVGDGYYRIYSQKRPSHGLHDSNLPRKEGSDAFFTFTARYQGFLAQQWRLIDTGDGYYRLVSRYSPVRGLSDSGKAYQGSDTGHYALGFPYRGANKQKWRLEVVGNVNANARLTASNLLK